MNKRKKDELKIMIMKIFIFCISPFVLIHGLDGYVSVPGKSTTSPGCEGGIIYMREESYFLKDIPDIANFFTSELISEENNAQFMEESKEIPLDIQQAIKDACQRLNLEE